jgi:hypothetical protein
MDLHIDDARPDPSNAGHGFVTEAAPRAAMAEARSGLGDARSTIAPPVGGSPAGLRTRLQAVADDIDRLWRDALEGQNFDLVTRAVDASHGVHRALLALGDDRFVIEGASRGSTTPAGSHVGRAAS